MNATDEEWRTAFAAYADRSRRKFGEVAGTFEECMNDPVKRASIACLILEVRSRRTRYAAAQSSRAISAPHQLGRTPSKKVPLDRKMLAAGEREDD